uniref:Uncharacterized protein n=1 Tax=Ditylenchus dipsaci TaxID=166011 RepID=A0A915DV21_9BILA
MRLLLYQHKQFPLLYIPFVVCPSLCLCFIECSGERMPKKSSVGKQTPLEAECAITVCVLIAAAVPLPPITIAANTLMQLLCRLTSEFSELNSMAKLFRFLRNKKALGKENFLDDDDHIDRQNRRQQEWVENQCYNNNDEEDDSSEVTLKAPPLNPYHVITEPKKRRAPRSCPGGPSDLDDFGGRGRSRGRMSGAATTIGDHDLSFQSVDEKDYQRGKQFRKLRYLDSLHSNNNQPQPFRELANGRSVRESSSRGNANNPKSSRNHYKNVKQDNENEDDEWTNKRIPKYEEKIQDLTESLYQAINNERQAKKERKFWHQKHNDTMNKNMKLQSDIEALRTLIYGLESELHNLRTSLAQRDDYHSSSSTAFRHPLHHGLTHMHHQQATITPLLSNTGTTSSTGGGPGSAVIGSTPRHQQLPDATKKLAGGGSGESLALLSSSSLCPAGSNCAAHLSQPKGGVLPTNGGSSAGSRGRMINTLPHHQQQIAPSSSSAFDSPRFRQFYDKIEENFGDEVKNFRSLHAESFSGSSRQGTEDEELERIKSEFKQQMSCSAMSSRTSKGQHSDTSSPARECPRGNNTITNGSRVSASCLGISLYNDSSIMTDRSGSSRNFSSSHEIMAVRDDGYSTSETVSTILLPLSIATNSSQETNRNKNIMKSPCLDNRRVLWIDTIQRKQSSKQELKKSASFTL